MRRSRTTKTMAALAALMMSGGIALAQTAPKWPPEPPHAAVPPEADPRLASAQIGALQAILKLRESELKALDTDSRAAIANAQAAAEAREATLIEWLKAAQAKSATAATPPEPAPAAPPSTE